MKENNKDEEIINTNINPTSFNSRSNYLGSSLNQPLNQPLNQSQQYPTFTEINGQQDMIYYLREISRNVRRNNEDGVFTNFSIIFLISLFFSYLMIRFYRSGGFEYERLRILLGMIIGVFLMVILLHRHETNILKHLKKT